MKRIALLVGLAVIGLPAAVASAELCRKCKGMAYIMTVGQCVECKAATTSGAFKLCKACSARLRQCESCRTPLAAGKAIRPPTGPITVGPAPSPAVKIDLTKSGKYKSGKWEYRLVVTHPGTRSEGRRGTLRYGGKALPEAGMNDYYQTPWGRMYWVGDPNMIFGDHRWMPQPRAGQRRGKLLTPAGLPDVAWGAQVNGVRLGAGLVADASAAGKTPVRLAVVNKGKPVRWLWAWKFWSSVRLTGEWTDAGGKRTRIDMSKVPYPPGLDDQELPAGAETAIVLNLPSPPRPGSYTLRLRYASTKKEVVSYIGKPRHPHRHYQNVWTGEAEAGPVTVKIRGPAAGKPPAGAKQGVTGKVIKLKGNFMPGPGPVGGRRISLSVPVHVFAGKVKPFKKPDPRHAQLVKTVTSGKDGSFKAALPPGVYTVVAEIEGKLYLNVYTVVRPEGTRWGTVTVEKGKWTRFTIEDASEAAF